METRSFRKSFFVVALLLCMTAFFMLFGCGDIYKNIKITTETQEVALWLNSDDESKPSTQTVSVTVAGIGDKNISKTLRVTFEGNPNIATATRPVVDANGQASFQVEARAPGEATMYVKLEDNTSISSEGIKVSVTEPVTKLFTTSSNLMVERGSSLNLVTSGKINFLPVTTTENDVDFFFPIAGQAGGTQKDETRGLSIENGVLKADDNAGVGLVTILAKSTTLDYFDERSPLQTTFQVLVCDSVDEEKIFVQEKTFDESEEEVLNNITLIENYSTDEESFNKKYVAVKVQNKKGQEITQFLSYDIVAINSAEVSQISSLGIVDVSHNYDSSARMIEDEFVITAQSAGSTTYYIKVSIVDESGNVYKTFLTPLDITVKTIVTSIYATTKEGLEEEIHKFDIGSAGSLNIKVFDEKSYVEQDPGTWVYLTTSESSDTSLRVTVDSFSLLVNDSKTEYRAEDFVGEDVPEEEKEFFAKYASMIKVLSSKKQVISFGELFEKGKDIFITFDDSKLEDNESFAGFTLKVWANNNDTRFLFPTTINCGVSISYGVLDVEGVSLAKVGQTLVFEANSEIAPVDLSFFDIIYSRQDIISDPQILNNTFSVTALKVGEINIVLQEKYSLTRTIVPIQVVVPTKFVWINAELQDGIADIQNREEPISESIREQPLEKVVVGVEGQSLGFYAYIRTSEANANIKSVEYEFVSSSGTISSILTNTSTINFIVSQIDGEDVVKINITYYTLNEDDVVVEDVYSQEITIESYIPISTFAWDASGTIYDATFDIYDSAEISLANQQEENVGFVLLKPYLSSRSTRSYDIIKQVVERNVYGVSVGGSYDVGDMGFDEDDYFTIEERDGGLYVSAKIGKNPDGTSSQVRGSVSIQFFIKEFNKIRSVGATINFVAPTEKVDLLNFDNDTIYLEKYYDGGYGNYGSSTIDVFVASKNVFDSGLTYVVYDSHDAVSYIFDDRLETLFKGADYPISVGFNDEGKVVAKVNPELQAFSSTYFIKVFPSEVLNVEYNEDNVDIWLEKFGSSVAKVVEVTLHDGVTKERAYKVLDSQDFLCISTSPSSFFELQDDVLLLDTFESMSEFSGSLFSTQGFCFKVSGFVATQGFFAKSLTGSIFDVEFSYGNTEVETNTFGLVVLENRGTISGVKVSAYEESEIKVNVADRTQTVIVGGVVAENTKDMLNVSGFVNLTVTVTDFGDMKGFYVGGIVGYLHQGGVVNYDDELNFVANLNLVSNTVLKNSAVGGIAGWSNQGQIAGNIKEISENNVITKSQGILNVDAIINASNFDNVGGIVGVFENANATTKQIYVVPTIVAHDNVGGAFGVLKNISNETAPKRIFVEFYGEGSTRVGIFANENVGGVVGVMKESGTLTESYALSYVNLEVCKFGEPISDGTKFYYGDIVAKNNVGGVVGTFENSTISICFARVKINVNTEEESPIVGGFVGNFSADVWNHTMTACFFVGDVFVFGPEEVSAANLGGFVGLAEVDGGASVLECYAVVDNGFGIKLNPYENLDGEVEFKLVVQNFCGTANSLVGGTSCYYAINDNYVDSNYGAAAKFVSFMKKQDPSMAAEILTWTDAWYKTDDGKSINNDFPVLCVSNEITHMSEPLFGKQMTNISISSRGMGEIPVKRNDDGTATEATFPTFWTFDSQNLKLVVSMDSLALTTYKTFVISRVLISDETICDLVGIRTDNDDKKVTITSDNPKVVAISNPATFELEFKSVGNATITITSRKNSTITASFEICVIGGFVDFDMYYYTNGDTTQTSSVDIENKIITAEKEVLQNEFLVGELNVSSWSNIDTQLSQLVMTKFERTPKQNDVVFVSNENVPETIFKYVYGSAEWNFNVITTLQLSNYSEQMSNILDNRIRQVAPGGTRKVGDSVVVSIVKDGFTQADVVYKFTYTQTGWLNSKLIKIARGGAVYLYTSFIQAQSTIYDDSYAVIYEFDGDTIEIVDATLVDGINGVVASLDVPYQTINSNTENLGEGDRVIATLAIKLKFKDFETLLPLNMTATDITPQIRVQKAFKPYIFEGVSALSLSENVGEIANSETFEVSLIVKSDSVEEVLKQDSSGNYLNLDRYLNNAKSPMQIYFSDNESNVFTLKDFNLDSNAVVKNSTTGEITFNSVDGVMVFENSSGTPINVHYVCTPSASKIVFDLEFSYWQVRLSEPVVEYVLFGAVNDDGSTKTASVQINWQPTKITTLELLHYQDKSDYKLDYGKDQASTEIGSGKLGLLKVSIIQPYADYDYIVISSDENNPYKISFAHYLVQKNSGDVSSLVYSDEYSSTSLTDGSITIYNNQSVITNSVFYVSTLTEVGIPERTYLKINVVAYKSGTVDTVVGTRSIVLSSVFAPYVQLSVQSDFGNFVARGTETTIVANGVAENSRISFSVEGISSDSILKSAVLFEKSETPTIENPTYANQSGSVSFALSLYVGILAEATDGEIVVVGTVYTASGQKVTEYRLKLYVVDFLITSINVENLDSSSNTLLSRIQDGYTALKVTATTDFGIFAADNRNVSAHNKAATDLFKKYYPSSYSEYVSEFNSAFSALRTTIRNNLKNLNSLGASVSGASIWNYNKQHMSVNTLYENFFINSEASFAGDTSYVVVRGRVQIKDPSFGVSFERGYMLSNGFYESYLGLNSIAGVLGESIYLYSKDFVVDFVSSSTEESPDPIYNAEELQNMIEGGHYILMNDIYLHNWTPLSTKIGSLDGNGHVLTLQNFNIKTKTESGSYVQSIDVGLFATLSTFENRKTGLEEPSRLLNIILDVSPTVVTDLRGVANVNFGFLVAHNQGGIIYNCDIINTYSASQTEEVPYWTEAILENTIINNTFVQDRNTQANWLRYVQTDENIIKFLNQSNGVLKNSYSYANDIFTSWLDMGSTNVANIYTRNVVSSFIFVSPVVNGENVDANVGGLVGFNDTNSYITNSRVGRVGNIRDFSVDGNSFSLDTKVGLNLFGGGRFGGLVGQNDGTIASSFFANGSVVNLFNTTHDDSMVGGLVGLNGYNGKINTSYVQSTKKDIDYNKYNHSFVIDRTTYFFEYDGTDATDGQILNSSLQTVAFAQKTQVGTNVFRFTFVLNNVEYVFDDLESDSPKIRYTRASENKIYSTGPAAGFVNKNEGEVENCFSNIEIVSSLGVGGFVYTNIGQNSVVEDCYTASLLNSSSNMNGQFVGVDATLNVLNQGSVENCFYLIDEGFGGNEIIKESLVDPATALKRANLRGGENSKLWGFVFQNENSTEGDGIWKSSDDEYTLPNLVQANFVTMSRRVIIINQNDDKINYKYVKTDTKDYTIGTINNPRLVYSVATFNEAFPEIDQGSEKNFIRFVADVDFAGDSPEFSYKNNFTGRLWGNGMNIKQFNILNGETEYLGLFSVIGDEGQYAVVSNLVLTPDQISGTQRFAVGGLAGRIGNADVNNIKIYAFDTESRINGFNATGGLAGIVNVNGKRNRVENIKSSITVVSTYSPSTSGDLVFYETPEKESDVQKHISYAGGVIGVVDYNVSIFADGEKDPAISNCMTFGNVTIGAEIVGGVFGFVGQNSTVSASRFVLNQKSDEGQSLQGLSFSGGIVGENRGLIEYSYVALPGTIQQMSDEALVLNGLANDQLVSETLFEKSNLVVGGIVGLNIGHTQNGKLSKTGRIMYSYNRGNVVSSNAVVAGGVVGLSVPTVEMIKKKANLNNIINTATLSSALSVYEYINVAEAGEEENFVLRNQKADTNESDTISISLYINNVYTTGKVSGKQTTGGLVGISAGIVETQNTTQTIVIPSSFESNDTSENVSLNDGALFGKVLYSARTVKDEKDFLILFSSGFSPAISTIVTYDEDGLYSDGKHKVVVGNFDIRTKEDGNGNTVLDSIIYNDCYCAVRIPFDEFYDVAIRLETLNSTFAPFESSDTWRLDKTRSNIIFPRLVTGKTVSVQTISTEDEFFEYIKGGEVGNFVINSDLTFDLSAHPEYVTKFKTMSSQDAPISGSIRGEKSDGSGVMIKLLNNTQNISLFGYIKSLSVENIDFVFDSSLSVTNTDIDYFGLVAYTSQSCRFTNINLLSMQSSKEILIKTSGFKGIGGMLGKSQNDYFTQISANIAISSEASAIIKDRTLQIGGLVGLANHMTISKSNVTFKSKVQSDEKVDAFIGAYAGYVGGYVSVNASTSSTGVISNYALDDAMISLSNADSSLYLGGVFGQAECSSITSKIQNITVGKNITQNGTNNLVGFKYTILSNGENYVGGIVGTATSVGFVNCQVLKMEIPSFTIAEKSTYVGGIAGKANSIVSTASNGGLQAINALTGLYANVLFDEINNSAGRNNKLYVGGLVGDYSIKQVARSFTSSSYYELYGSSYTTGYINIEGKTPVSQHQSPLNELYVSGMIGNLGASYNTSDQESSELFNASFSFGQSASDVNVVISNTHHLVCAGGIAGYSDVAISNCFNYGTISNNDQENVLDQQAYSYVGGIVGRSTSTLYSVHSFGAIFGANNMIVNGPSTENLTQRSFAGAILGESLASVAISGGEYCLDFVGVLQDDDYVENNLQKLSIEDVFKVETGSIIYRKSADDEEYHLPYFAVFENLIKNQNTNVFVTKVSSRLDFTSAMLDETNKNKTILFVFDLENDEKPQIELEAKITIQNATKIVGNGTMFVTSSTVFSEIPQNVLVSGIIVTSNGLTLNAKGSSVSKQIKIDNNDKTFLAFGALSPINNGLVVNCVAGMLPSKLESSDTIAISSDGLNNEEYKNLTASLNVKISDLTNASVGSLIGFNNNVVLGCWSYSDMEINATSGYVGGLVGFNNGALSYSYVMGRIVNTVDSSDFLLGGVVGYINKYKTTKQIAAFVDISSVSNYGPVVGKLNDTEDYNTMYMYNFIAVTDMSKQVFAINTHYTQRNYTERKNMVGTKVGQLSSEFFSVDTGSQTTDLNLNYGLPFLTLGTSSLKNFKNSLETVQDIRFTGDGFNSPYEIENFTTLKRVQESSYSGRKFALTRDIYAYDQIYSSNTSFSLDGNYKTIFVSELPNFYHYYDKKDDEVKIQTTNFYTLFNLTLRQGTIEKLKLKIVDGSVALNPSSNAVIAPLLRELSDKTTGEDKVTIENCAVFGSVKISGSGSGNVGGLVGNFNGGIINQCWTDVKFEIENVASGYKVGGLVGSMGVNTTLSQSFASGPIMVSKSTNMAVGGLVGIINVSKTNTIITPVKILNCYFSGLTKHQSTISEITFKEDESSGYLGAFAGMLGGNSPADSYHYELLTANNTESKVFTIENCYFAGKLSHFKNTTYQVTISGREQERNIFTNVGFGYVYNAEYKGTSGNKGYWTFTDGYTFDNGSGKTDSKIFKNIFVCYPSIVSDITAPDFYYPIVVTNPTYLGKTGNALNGLSEKISSAYSSPGGVKQYLLNTTPSDRTSDDSSF